MAMLRGHAVNWPVYLPFGSIRPIALAFDAPAHLIPDKGQFRSRFHPSTQLWFVRQRFFGIFWPLFLAGSGRLRDNRRMTGS